MEAYLEAIDVGVFRSSLPKPKDLVNLVGDEIHYRSGTF
jgi:hypothetical protein